MMQTVPRALMLVAVSLVAALPRTAASQSDEREAVRRAVLDYVEGFYEGDSTRFVRSVMPEVFKFGYWFPRDSGRYVGEHMSWPEFHAYAHKLKASGQRTPASASKDIVVFDVLDQIASAKLVAYWGVDYLLLAKRDGRWMISQVLWQTPPRTR